MFDSCLHNTKLAVVTLNSNFKDMRLYTDHYSPFKLGETLIAMATTRSFETLFIILATHQLDWASVATEFGETQRQREKRDSWLNWYLGRCLCSVKLKRHNWNVSETCGRYSAKKKKEKENLDVISLHASLFDIAVISYWYRIWVTSWNKHEQLSKKNQLWGQFGNSAWRPAVWS